MKSSAAAGSASTGTQVHRCAKPLGTLAVDDGRDEAWSRQFSQNSGVASVEPMIRLVAQQSNCFIITSGGNSAMNEKLAGLMDQNRSDETRVDSNTQKGQRVATDYFLDPTILYANSDGGAAGAVLGGFGGMLGGLAAMGMKKKHTTVNLSLFSVRTGAQIAASTGSVTATELGGGLGGVAGIGGALGGYTKTPEGKALVGSYLDAYNSMVIALQNYQAQGVEGGTGRGGTMDVN